MRSLSFAVTLVLLLVAVWARGLPNAGQPNVIRPPCDSPDVEAAAMVAQDYLNAQHAHGYKYVLNRIEDVKIITTPSGEATYEIEVELLETTCHVLDPTPLMNCSVRPKVMTAIEGDCDVVLKNVGGALIVTAFKCKTEESREDFCIACPTLLPMNDTSGLDFVHASIKSVNVGSNNSFILMEVGRMSKQPVSGGDIIVAEFVIIEANCTGSECVPLDNAERGFCVAQGLGSDYTLNCSTFGVPPINSNTAVSSPSLLPMIHAMPGLGHHKLTPIHNPSEFLSAESAESTESGEVVQVMQVALGSSVAYVAADPPPSIVVPVVNVVLDQVTELLPGNLTVEVQAVDLADVTPTVGSVLNVALPAGDESTKAVVVKRAAESVEPVMLVPTELPLLLVPQCPGRIRHY